MIKMFLVNTFLLFKFLIFFCCFSYLLNLGLLRRSLKIICLTRWCICLILDFLIFLAFMTTFTFFIYLFCSDCSSYRLLFALFQSVFAELILWLRLKVLSVMSRSLSARRVCILLATFTAALLAPIWSLLSQRIARMEGHVIGALVAWA